MDSKWLAWRTRPKVKPSDVDSTAQALFAAMVKDRISPAMRGVGFKGSGGRYELKHETLWALVGFQKSVYSDAREVQFTVNLLVADKQEWSVKVAEQTHYPERPAPGTLYGDPVHQTRIGALTPEGEDKWWRVTDAALVAEVAADCIQDLELYGVPWMLNLLEG